MNLAIRTACLLIALVAIPLRGQNPMAVKSVIPTPGCGANIKAIADYDSSGFPDFHLIPYQIDAIATVHDPFMSGGGTCTVTPIPGFAGVPGVGTFAASLNGDAHKDALIWNENLKLVLDAYGNGTGGFTFPGTGPHPTPPAVGYVTPVAVGDVNHDGRDDAVILCSQPIGFPLLRVYLNLPSGWFVTWFLGLTAAPNSNFAIADVNGDNNVDIVWTESSFATSTPEGLLRTAHGSGFGSFTLSCCTVSLGPQAGYVAAVEDLNADALGDIVIVTQAHPTPKQLRVVFGVPPGIVPTSTDIPLPYGSIESCVVLDFDVDGTLDIAVEGNYWPTPGIRETALLRGLGAGTFSTPIVIGTEVIAPWSFIRLLKVDMDADGDPDLVRHDLNLNTGTVWQRLDNQTVYSGGCAGTNGAIPSTTVATATPGNAAFAIGLSGALPNSAALLGISLARVPVSGCGVGLSLDPMQLVLPTPALGLFSTGAGGTASFAIAIPPIPSLAGLTFYTQWAVADPQGAFGFLGASFSLTPARTVFVW